MEKKYSVNLYQIFCVVDGTLLAVGSHDNFIYLYVVTENGRKYSRYGKCTVSFGANIISSSCILMLHVHQDVKQWNSPRWCFSFFSFGYMFYGVFFSIWLILNFGLMGTATVSVRWTLLHRIWLISQTTDFLWNGKLAVRWRNALYLYAKALGENITLVWGYFPPIGKALIGPT